MRFCREICRSSFRQRFARHSGSVRKNVRPFCLIWNLYHSITPPIGSAFSLKPFLEPGKVLEPFGYCPVNPLPRGVGFGNWEGVENAQTPVLSCVFPFSAIERFQQKLKNCNRFPGPYDYRHQFPPNTSS